MFLNKQHDNLKVYELRAFGDETESSARKRLEGLGWIFPDDVVFETDRKVFVSKEAKHTKPDESKEVNKESLLDRIKNKSLDDRSSKDPSILDNVEDEVM